MARRAHCFACGWAGTVVRDGALEPHCPACGLVVPCAYNGDVYGLDCEPCAVLVRDVLDTIAREQRRGLEPVPGTPRFHFEQARAEAAAAVDLGWGG